MLQAPPYAQPMPHNLTETPTRGSPVSVPDPGDARTAASVDGPFQTLANRVAYLEANGDACRDFNLQMPIESAVLDSLVGGNWVYTNGFWWQTDVAAAAKLWIPLRLPVGATLTTVTVFLSGATLAGAAAHAGVPATKPKITLKASFPSSDTTTTLGTVIGTATDGSASVGAYDTAHTITISGLSEVVTGSKRYAVALEGENGANAAANKLACFGLAVVGTHP